MVKLLEAISTLLIGVCITSCLGGCLETIDIPIPEGYRESIAITGVLVHGDPSVFRMNVTQLFSFTTASRGTIRTSEATIEDSEGNRMILNPQGTGRFYHEFQAGDAIQVRPGLSYKVSVSLLDGRRYDSQFEKLQTVAEIDYVQLGVATEVTSLSDFSTRVDTFVSFFVNSDLRSNPGEEKNFLRWEFERVAKITDNPPLLVRDGAIDAIDRKICYISTGIAVTKTKVYPGPYLNAERLDDYEVLKDLATRFYGEGQYFTVWQESLSEGAYEYWEDVRASAEEGGDFFGPQPGKIKSNFVNPEDLDDEVFGYFYATQRDSLRFYIDPELIFGDTLVPACPLPVVLNPDGTCPDKLCCDCLSESRSTTERPSYWVN